VQTRTVWVAFGLLALWAYILYALGNATPYLRAELGLTAFEAGLHGSALAVGVLVAGFTSDAVGRRIGGSRLLDLAVLDLSAALVLVSFAPSIAVSLPAALLLGLGGGSMGTQVNVELTRAGEAESRRLMSLGNGWAMIAAAAAPLAIGLAAQLLHAWRLALLLPIAGLLAVSAIRPRADGAAVVVQPPRAALPRGYWIAWLFLVAAVSIEFSVVFWGSTVIATRTGASSGEATLLASLFVAGMFAGRMAIGRGAGGQRGSRGLLVAGAAVVVAGAALVLASPLPLLSGVGLFVCGLGTAPMWPVGLSVAMGCAPQQRLQAAARATLAAGLAVLIAPSALGLASDAVGVVAAWPLVGAIAGAGLLALVAAPRGTQPFRDGAAGGMRREGD
jgi:MFS family permease